MKLILFFLNNSIPLLGVFFYGWDGLFVVQFCFIEICIASLFDYVKFPFLKNNPKGEYGQGIMTLYSFFMIPFMFFISSCMVSICGIKLISWDKFIFPALLLAGSYTAQLVHFMVFDRLNPGLYRIDISKFSVLRCCILLGAMMLLPWVGLLFIGSDSSVRQFDILKGMIVLMFLLRTLAEVNIVYFNKAKQSAVVEDL